MKVKSFKTKLILSYAAVILISFAFLSFFLDKSLENNSLKVIESSLITQARLIENQITAQIIKKESPAFLEDLVKKLSFSANCRVTVIDIKGKVLADSEKLPEEIAMMENHIGRTEVRTALTGSPGIEIRYSPTLKIDMLYAALPIKDNNDTAGILRLALPLESVQKTLFVIRKIVVIGLLFALVFAFILGSILASRAIEPINRMIFASRRFSEGDFTRRVTVASKDEIGELAVTFNKMAQEIEDKIKNIGDQHQKLAAIFNSMIEGIIVVDNGTRLISINPAVEKIFDISKKDAEGKLFLEVIRNNDIFEVIAMARKTGKTVSGEIKLIYPISKIFELNATPIFSDNTVSGCLVVIHDITEIRKLETVRRDFIANVSHELKTPLTSITGFVETLLDGALDDKPNSREFLKIIQEHALRLNNLVNDLLSLSHLESENIELNKQDVDLRRLVEEITLGFKSQLRKKNINIENNLSPAFSVKADRNRIEQVFTNLIDNAIKFNKEKGFIKVYGREVDGKAELTVEDSGAGIPQQDIPRVFERFYRVDKARSRDLGGTGLGLSIVKHIVELHGGSVGVESIEGLGSKFHFTIPK